jgi:hypothetical protein
MAEREGLEPQVFIYFLELRETERYDRISETP